MLGEQIGELTGKTNTTRVLAGDDFRYVKMEVSWQESGTMLGIPMMDFGTIVTWERLPGQLYGEGQGIAEGAQGGVIWRAQSIGRMSGEGMSMSIRFALTFQAPLEGPLSRLNGVVGIGEQEVDAEGNIHTTLWEWK
ncbi:MAG: hypothetical protein WC273_10990 [Dehalococcoidia bacterium]